MNKYKIDIEGLPEGWEPVAYRIPDRFSEERVLYKGQIHSADNVRYDREYLIVQKTKPRQIVLEETGEFRKVKYKEWYETDEGRIQTRSRNREDSAKPYKIWRIKEE